MAGKMIEKHKIQILTDACNHSPVRWLIWLHRWPHAAKHFQIDVFVDDLKLLCFTLLKIQDGTIAYFE